MAGGRPTKYKPEICKQLPELFEDGASIAEVCVELGITKSTFYEWGKKYREFSDAIKRGLVLSEAWWSRFGQQGAMGKVSINPAMWIFNMKNRFGWADKQEITGAEGGEIVFTLAMGREDDD
jgi:hypothetical protein